MATTLNFDDLVGHSFHFYGVDNNCFNLDQITWEAIEDESDGYRSMMEEVQLVKEGLDTKIFFQYPIAYVRIEHTHNDTDDLYTLVDTASGHVWLKFGTHDLDDYYPTFVFFYQTPEEAQAAKEEQKKREAEWEETKRQWNEQKARDAGFGFGDTSGTWRIHFGTRSQGATIAVPTNIREACILIGAQPTDTIEAIKKAFRAKALVTHPDTGGSEEAMKRLNAAYTLVLKWKG